jgi:hypothetical protein
VRGANAEVVHAAGVADGRAAFGVEPVVAGAVVLLGACTGGSGFGCGAVGIARCSAVQGAVRAALVVMRLELVELAL